MTKPLTLINSKNKTKNGKLFHSLLQRYSTDILSVIVWLINSSFISYMYKIIL